MRRARRSLLSLAVLALTLALGLTLSPSAAAFPPGQIGSASINATVFRPGDTVVVVVQHTTPGQLTMQLFSAPVTIGVGSVAPNGTGSVSGNIPAGYSGDHTIQVTGAGGEIYPFSITVTASVSGGTSGLLEDYSVRDQFDLSKGFTTLGYQADYSVAPNQSFHLSFLADDAYTASTALSSDASGHIQAFGDFVYDRPDTDHWYDGGQVTFTLTPDSGAAGLSNVQVLHHGSRLAGTGPADVRLSTLNPSPGQTVSVTGVNFNGTTTTGTVSPSGIPAGTYETGINGGIRGSFTVPTSARPGAYTLTLTDDIGNSGSASFTVVGAAVPGTFASVVPARILDTRSGVGAPKVKVKAAGVVALQVTGRGGVPATGVSAVVLNVTVATSTSSGYVTAYPNGAASRPTVSNLNYPGGAPIANLVTVPVGTGGKVALYNGGAAAVDLVADVAGYFVSGTPTVPGAFVAVGPTRLLDTRAGNGAPKAKVAPGASLSVQIGSRGGVPGSGVSAVVLNVTVANATAPGYLTVYPDTVNPRPTVSNLNYAASKPIANLVTVPVGGDGKVAFFNGGSAAVDVLADIAGYYIGGTVTTPGAFVAVSPARVLDTRKGIGATGRIAALKSLPLSVVGRGGVPATGAAAVVLNVTAVVPAGAGYVTVYPNTLSPRPASSNLNFAKGQTIPNLAVVPLGTDGKVGLYNGSASPLDLLADVAGYYLS